ncbi:MAG TPA: hypothetical protein VED01_02560 [Burkholderiales bacterium]|nr:hypothetical protein [Burkholderiales bacterium]
MAGTHPEAANVTRTTNKQLIDYNRLDQDGFQKQQSNEGENLLTKSASATREIPAKTASFSRDLLRAHS